MLALDVETHVTKSTMGLISNPVSGFMVSKLKVMNDNLI